MSDPSAPLLQDLPPLDRLNPEEGYLGWTFKLPESVKRDDIEEIFDFVGDDSSDVLDWV